MHYQHSFHAGNFADVFKHVVLCGLLAALSRKDKPWCYLETHAGAGVYDLSGAGAARTGEWRDGIGLLDGVIEASAPLADFLRIVGDLRRRGPSLYPGSPRIARALARPGDRLVLCEQVPQVMAALKAEFAGDRQVAFHARDGYEAHALLPPPEKRGLVLVDPPFERSDELEAIADFLAAAMKRYRNGIYAIWYPHKNRYQTERWLRRLRAGLAAEALNLHLDTGAPSAGQMHACGMLVINPPYSFATAVPRLLAALRPLLAQSAGAEVAHELWPYKTSS